MTIVSFEEGKPGLNATSSSILKDDGEIDRYLDSVDLMYSEYITVISLTMENSLLEEVKVKQDKSKCGITLPSGATPLDTENSAASRALGVNTVHKSKGNVQKLVKKLYTK